MLCDNPEGWDRVGDGREVQEGGDKCIPVADSCHVWQKPAQYCKAVTSNKIKKKKKKGCRNKGQEGCSQKIQKGRIIWKLLPAVLTTYKTNVGDSPENTQKLWTKHHPCHFQGPHTCSQKSPEERLLFASTFRASHEGHSLKVKVKVTQLCPTLCDPVDYTVHGIIQVRILEWVTFLFSRGSSQLRDQTQVTRIAGRFFTS